MKLIQCFNAEYRLNQLDLDKSILNLFNIQLRLYKGQICEKTLKDKIVILSKRIQNTERCLNKLNDKEKAFIYSVCMEHKSYSEVRQLIKRNPIDIIFNLPLNYIGDRYKFHILKKLIKYGILEKINGGDKHE